MRENNQKQMSPTLTIVNHRHAMEREYISKTLDRNATIHELVPQEITRSVAHSDPGAGGMISGEVVRAAILK